MIRKKPILYATFNSRAGYGTGFWVLLAGIAFAFVLLIQIDAGRPGPTVDRIPASEAIVK